MRFRWPWSRGAAFADPADLEELIFPDTVRLARADEMPPFPEGDGAAKRDEVLADIAAGASARFVAGYILEFVRGRKFAAYAEINVHAPEVWAVFRDLAAALLYERAWLMIADKDEKLRHFPIQSKAPLLAALEPFGAELARYGSVQFAVGSTREFLGRTRHAEVFVVAAKSFKVWTDDPVGFERVMARHGLKRVESMPFLDEFPRVTSRAGGRNFMDLERLEVTEMSAADVLEDRLIDELRPLWSHEDGRDAVG